MCAIHHSWELPRLLIDRVHIGDKVLACIDRGIKAVFVLARLGAGIYTDNRNLTLDRYFAEWLIRKRSGTKGTTLY